MVNHVRTLLLNLPRAGTIGEYGEEYIPATFGKITLPYELEKIRKILFMGTTNRASKNARVRQFMQLLHSSELAGLVLEFDNRITYDLRSKELFDADLPLIYKIDLSAIYAALKTAGDDTIAYLFNNQSSTAFRLFKNIWDHEKQLPFAMSALLLAYVHRVNTTSGRLARDPNEIDYAGLTFELDGGNVLTLGNDDELLLGGS